MMKCTELAKYGNKSVVEVVNTDTNAIVKYVVCFNFDNAKAYGNKWENGEYFNVDSSLGLRKEDMLKAAMLHLYGIDDPKIPYNRILEFAKAFFNNMDIDEEQAENLKSCFGLTEDEADFFGIKDKVFAKKYKIVEVTYMREQRATIKVIMPDDVSTDRVDEYISGEEYLGDQYTEDGDWELEDYDVCDEDLSEYMLTHEFALDELWNGSDFPDYID